MTLGDWTAGRLDPPDLDSGEAGRGEPPRPSPDEWHAVTVPGRPERFADADAVGYRTTFPDPRAEGEERATLELRGLFAHAHVWLNDEYLGRHDAYFLPARFEFEPADENELVVECRAPADRFGGVYDTDLLAPTETVPGIWWDASVEGHSATYLADLSVTPSLDEDGGRLDVALTVEAGEPLDERATLSLKPRGFRGRGAMERAHVVAEAGERVTVERSLMVEEPAFWWPREHGPQNFYELRASLGESERTTATGFRTVTHDDDGLRVNGRRVRARGFNVLPSDSPTADVERATAANATLVRSHAHVPPEEVHRACDEAGLLVWQDLPLTGPGRYDEARGAELAGALADVRGHHPSVAMFGVHDDPLDALATVGSGWLARYRLRYRAWRTSYDRGDDDAVAAALPADRPVFPVSGGPGLEPDAASLYPGWSYADADDVDWLLDTYPGLGSVVGEFGAGGLAGTETEHLAATERAQHDELGNDVPASQRAQARTLKAVAEGLRQRESDVLAAFALRDTGGSSMGVLTRDGTEKSGYGALADSFEPVQVMTDGYPGPGSTDVVAVNDTTEQVSGTVTWEAGDLHGRMDVTVESMGRMRVETVRIPRDATALSLQFAFPERTVTNTYSL